MWMQPIVMVQHLYMMLWQEEMRLLWDSCCSIRPIHIFNVTKGMLSCHTSHVDSQRVCFLLLTDLRHTGTGDGDVCRWIMKLYPIPPVLPLLFIICKFYAFLHILPSIYTSTKLHVNHVADFLIWMVVSIKCRPNHGMLPLVSVNAFSSRHKGKTALEMACKKPNLKALMEEHTATNEPTHVNGMSNGSVSPLLKRCSLTNRGKPLDRLTMKCPKIEIFYDKH